jgi:predicted transcriptional regulator
MGRAARHRASLSPAEQKNRRLNLALTEASLERAASQETVVVSADDASAAARRALLAKHVRDDRHLDSMLATVDENRRALVRAEIRRHTTFANEPEPYYVDAAPRPLS